ncbi:hypothetical protein PHMEG_0003548 [Phytophthora megakarya]|uniref:Uncharacterized protein n=1 Tax=Phytophthora megakarya TaxID=4795 RepID=A0A225WYF1_9STRA|nr:hypothetical protein PHMEG_0003548 [Phytophthora megakarya]
MLFKYIREPDMLMHVPEVRKMENHKAYLKRTERGGWEINKFETLRNWASLKMYHDYSSFHSVDEDICAEMNAVIVLDEFEHMSAVIVSDEFEHISAVGCIYGCRRYDTCTLQKCSSGSTRSRVKFGNVDGLALPDSLGWVDSYRLWRHIGGDDEIRFCVAISSLVIYSNTQQYFLMSTFRYQVQLSTTQMQSLCTRLGLANVEILACWEHLLRQSRKQTKLAAGKYFVKERVQPHPRLLHGARSLKQFRVLAKRVLTAWKAENEGNLANYRQSAYSTPRWERWSVGSSTVPGFLPTQQPVESRHKVIKVIVTDFKGLQRYRCSTPYCHGFCCSLPLGTVMKAKDHLIDSQNHRIVHTKATQTPARIF